jgi:hypothetical protein
LFILKCWQWGFWSTVYIQLIYRAMDGNKKLRFTYPATIKWRWYKKTLKYLNYVCRAYQLGSHVA